MSDDRRSSPAAGTSPSTGTLASARDIKEIRGCEPSSTPNGTPWAVSRRLAMSTRLLALVALAFFMVAAPGGQADEPPKSGAGASVPSVPGYSAEVHELVDSLRRPEGWKTAVEALAARPELVQVLTEVEALVRVSLRIQPKQPLYATVSDCEADEACLVRLAVHSLIVRLKGRAGPLVPLLWDLIAERRTVLVTLQRDGLMLQIGEPALPFLVGKALAGARDERIQALTLLASFTTAARPALDVIHRLLRDDDPGVRALAVHAVMTAASDLPDTKTRLRDLASSDPDENVRNEAKFMVEQLDAAAKSPR